MKEKVVHSISYKMPAGLLHTHSSNDRFLASFLSDSVQDWCAAGLWRNDVNDCDTAVATGLQS